MAGIRLLLLLLLELFICAEGGPGFFMSAKRLLPDMLLGPANDELRVWMVMLSPPFLYNS